MATTLVIKNANFEAHRVAKVNLDGAIPCTGIELDETSYQLKEIGGSVLLTATLTPADTTDMLSWGSSDESVAIVSNGTVTATGLGTATITATCGNQIATCSILVDEVVPSFVAVAGYSPNKVTEQSNTLTVGKGANNISGAIIIAKDQAQGSLPVAGNPDVDTSPYRFVPIMIPNGATQIKISTTLARFFTRALWCDTSKIETVYNNGVWCCQAAFNAWEQQSSVTEYVYDIPTNVQGLDSVCFCVGLAGGVTVASWDDYADNCTFEFLIGE